MTDDFVPSDIVQERMQQLLEVVERHALAKHEARVGRTEQVLVEGPSKRDPAVWSGRTRQNKLVHFEPDAGQHAGVIRKVRIDSASPHFLRGGLVDRRVRIPVSAGPA